MCGESTPEDVRLQEVSVGVDRRCTLRKATLPPQHKLSKIFKTLILGADLRMGERATDRMHAFPYFQFTGLRR